MLWSLACQGYRLRRSGKLLRQRAFVIDRALLKKESLEEEL